MSTLFQTTNPVNNHKLQAYQKESEEGLSSALLRADESFVTWRSLSFSERAVFFYKIEELLQKNAEEYAQMITQEMGKPITQSKSEIEKSAWVCRYYATHAEAFLQPQSIEADYTKSYVAYQPLGAILQIMPWNFPFWQVFRFSVPALMAGNVTVLKHAPNVLGCARLIEDIFQQAGVPKGVFQQLVIDVEQVPEVISHPAIQGVALTGSVRAGSAVGALAGQHIKQLVLELGGSDAFVVLEDADLPQAAKVAVRSRMNNSGQTCISAKRFIVEESVAEAFKQLVKKEIAQLNIGAPLDPATNISAMARPDLAEALQKQVDKSIEMGAVSEIGGGRQGDTNYFHPMLLSNIQKGMPAYDEELFGPVIAFFTVANEEEAIALANDSIFGLGATVWSQDIEKAESVALQIEVGAVAINKVMSSDPRIPFGGIKQSGIGRELGKDGIFEFVNVKSIVVG